MTRLFRAFFLSICLLLAGCQLTDYTVARRSTIDAQIAAARADTTSKLNLLSAQQVSLLQQSVADHEAREQGASDYLTKAGITFLTLRTPSRAEMVMGQSVQQTATQLPPPSAAAQAKAYQDIKVELDESKVTTAALQAQYDAELTKARADGAAKDKALTDIAASLKQVNDEKVDVLTKAKDTEAQLSDKRKALDDSTIASRDKDLATAKSAQAIKQKMAFSLGGIALLCLAGAIFSPVFKPQLGLAAAALGLAATVVIYLEGWMVLVALGVCLLAVVCWAVKNHFIASKTLSNVVNAVQEVKTTAKADYDRVLAPVLASWQTTYDKTGKPVPDTAAIAHVDSVLMASGTK